MELNGTGHTMINVMLLQGAPSARNWKEENLNFNIAVALVHITVEHLTQGDEIFGYDFVSGRDPSLLNDTMLESRKNFSECVLVKDPRHQVKELQQEVSRLCSISGDEKEIDWILSETWRQEEPEPPAVLEEGQVESVLIGLQRRDSSDGEGRKFVTFGNGRKAPAFPEDLQLQNIFSPLVVDEWLGALCNEALELGKPETRGSTRREQW
ncbi:hypothetical protein llap_4546 [Limosa lapponica baueri]|uniref:Uncharacterized protein n=1 Tax=Limosa lapponica baueri TaxID=1758121 RepID=A0A2I0UGH1_LIMLA|nr:hypothetical protein llap_4546 [Limosa lapponica baueri]